LSSPRLSGIRREWAASAIDAITPAYLCILEIQRKKGSGYKVDGEEGMEKRRGGWEWSVGCWRVTGGG
jgi:hypothetical protein